jgi:hypothetical protein
VTHPDQTSPVATSRTYRSLTWSWPRILIPSIVGAILGTAAVFGAPLTISVAIVAVVILSALAFWRPRDVSGPSFLLGAGLCGFALSAFSSANGYFGSFAVGVKGSYVQTYGTTGHTTVHSAFSISGMLVFGVVFAVGLAWLALKLRSPSHSGGVGGRTEMAGMRLGELSVPSPSEGTTASYRALDPALDDFWQIRMYPTDELGVSVERPTVVLTSDGVGRRPS